MILKILMFVPKFPFPIIGGMEKQSYLLSNELISQGLEISVLSTIFTKEHKSFELINGIKIYRIKVFKYKIISIIYQIFYIPLFLFISRKKFDVIHIHQHSLIGLYVLFLSKIFSFKTVVKLPNLGNKGLLGVSRSFLGNFKIAILKLSDVLIAMTPAHIDELLSLKFSEKKFSSIPNGILINPLIKNFSHINESVRFCYIGRLEKQKGIIFLLECWSEIVSKYPNVILEICGNGSLKDTIIEFLKSNRIENSVILSGYTNNVTDVLLRSDVFVITSETEGMSNAILEAMSFGKPIIASNVGGAKIQLKDNFFNSTFELNDKKKLIYLIQKNITDLNFRMTNANINYNRSLVFDIKNIANLYKELYFDIKLGHRLKKVNYDY